jgi:hypothetical protein
VAGFFIRIGFSIVAPFPSSARTVPANRFFAVTDMTRGGAGM